MQGKGIFARLIRRLSGKKAPLSDYQRAQVLIDAIDRGGIPLNAAKVNAVARDLGLEVSRKANIEDTIARIRAALARQHRHD